MQIWITAVNSRFLYDKQSWTKHVVITNEYIVYILFPRFNIRQSHGVIPQAEEVCFCKGGDR